MTTDQFNHAPAELFLYTGSPRTGGASMGSWITYGLGSENQDLPGFVVLISGGTDPTGGKALWSSGFLPSVYQGVQCRSEGEPILYVTDPKGMDRDVRRRSLDALEPAQRAGAAGVRRPGDADPHRQYELAYRMQIAVPEVMDISQGAEARARGMYGAKPGAGVVRQQLPAGPPAGRARGALRAALRLGLGHPRHRRRRRHRHGPAQEVQGGRPADRGAWSRT